MTPGYAIPANTNAFGQELAYGYASGYNQGFPYTSVPTDALGHNYNQHTPFPNPNAHGHQTASVNPYPISDSHLYAPIVGHTNGIAPKSRETNQSKPNYSFQSKSHYSRDLPKRVCC